jgi:hypothetical protein
MTRAAREVEMVPLNAFSKRPRAGAVHDAPRINGYGHHQIDLVILKRHDKLPAPLESACRWLSFFPLIKSSLK